MGALDLTVLFLAVDIVEVWLVVDWVSSLDAESVSVSSSRLELVDFVTDWLTHLIHWTHLTLWVLETQDLILVWTLLLVSLLSSLAAEWQFMPMR